MPWIKMHYYSHRDGRGVGYYGHCQSRQHFRFLLERWEVNPKDIESLTIDGKDFDPAKLEK